MGGTVLQGVFSVIIAIFIGVYYQWKLGLVATLFFPIMVYAVYVNQQIINGVDTVEAAAFEASAKLAIEAITNIRTVAGLRCEAKYVDMYIELLTAPHKLTIKKSHLRGFIFGFSQSIQFVAWAVIMWYGGYLVDQGETEFENVFIVTNAILNGAGMVGYSFAFTADFNKALAAAARVFHLLDRKPLIDTNPAIGLKLNQVEGNVDLKDAEFTYPTRQDVQILNRLQLSIKKGEKIALVGESGCGKSTVIQLIQRFYDLDGGSLELEENNIQSLNLPYVRSKMGIVSQEPVLFDRSIAENIQYGDNERTCETKTRTYKVITGYEDGECKEIEVCKFPGFHHKRSAEPNPHYGHIECEKETKEVCKKEPVVEEKSKDFELCHLEPKKVCEEKTFKVPTLDCEEEEKEE